MDLTLFYVAVICILRCDTARILSVYPTPSVSHHFLYRVITNELLARGHVVVVVTTDPAYTKENAPANLTEIDIHDAAYKIWRSKRTTNRGKRNFLKHLSQGVESINEIIETVIQMSEVKELLVEKNYDLLIIQEWVRPLVALTYGNKAPVVKISSSGELFGNYWGIGVPMHPLHYPVLLTAHRTFNLTFWEKMSTFYVYASMNYMYDSHLPAETAMLKRVFGEDIPSIEELNENVDMLFENIHQLWEGIRPIPPSLVHMGGIHKKPATKLPTDLLSFLDSSVHGVIYMSFGTNTPTRMLPPERIQMFIHVFSQLPYDVLWKWDEDELPGRTKNIRIGKWFPQSDLLRHDKIKIFITQGGMQSIDEALSAGVPMLAFPVASDQFFITENLLRYNIGLKFDFETIHENELRSAIETVIGDSSYRTNILRLHSLLLDQRQQPLQRVMWWIEYLLQHGGAKHLRCSSAHLSLAQYFELELLALVLGIVALTVFCVYIAFKYAWRCLLNTAWTSLKLKLKLNDYIEPTL